MAASPTPKPTQPSKTTPASLSAWTGSPIARHLQAWATRTSFPENQKIAVAYSGGADSTALLHAAAAQWPGRVTAIHVHHGLQAAADDFVRHCEATCSAIGVPLHAVHVDAKNASGESPEDAARKARYGALAGTALKLGLPIVALAQHADDQVETLLLALSRGAGVAGLAGMPAEFERFGVRFVRPLLGLGAQDIRDELDASSIGYIHDPTNDDLGYTRNKIRHRLLPVLADVFPHYRETFARSARNMALAQESLALAATESIAFTGNPPKISALQSLPRASQGNVLRHWLKTQFGATGSEAQMNELLDQIADCTNRGKGIRIKVASGFVERCGPVLAFSAASPPI
jgi:tRNA(Ile)-lysidine synthase